MSKTTGKEVVYPITVQFEDVDSYKIVHHTKLIAYLERARVHFFRELGYDLFDKTKEMVLYNLNISFKKTAKFLDDLVITTSINAVESFRFTLAYRILRKNELIAKAETDIAFIDAVTKKIIPVPEEFTV